MMVKNDILVILARISRMGGIILLLFFLAKLK
jgi:hypothetical protein